MEGHVLRRLVDPHRRIDGYRSQAEDKCYRDANTLAHTLDAASTAEWYSHAWLKSWGKRYIPILQSYCCGPTDFYVLGLNGPHESPCRPAMNQPVYFFKRDHYRVIVDDQA